MIHSDQPVDSQTYPFRIPWLRERAAHHCYLDRDTYWAAFAFAFARSQSAQKSLAGAPWSGGTKSTSEASAAFQGTGTMGSGPGLIGHFERAHYCVRNFLSSRLSLWEIVGVFGSFAYRKAGNSVGSWRGWRQSENAENSDRTPLQSFSKREWASGYV